MVLRFTLADGRIGGLEQITEPARLRRMELAILGERPS